MPVGTVTSIVGLRVGDREVPLRHANGCLTCASSQRYDLERLIMSGLSYAKVLEAVPDTGLSVRNLRDHTQAQHLPLKQAAKLVLAQKEDLTAAVVPVARGLARSVQFARAVVDRVEQQVADGSLQPGLADGIAAARLLADFEADDADSVEDLTALVLEIVDLIREDLDTPTFTRLFKRIQALPAMQALAS